MNDRITALEQALRSTLNFIENTESELGVILRCGVRARAALAASSTAPDCRQPDLVTADRSLRITGPNSDGDYWLHINAGGRTGGINLGSEHGICKRLLDAASRDAALDLTPAPEVEPGHPDDMAVDRFAVAMKAKLARKRLQGRGGWDGPECDADTLSRMLREHVEKGDPLDVGNLAMMLHQRGERISAPAVEPVATPQECATEGCGKPAVIHFIRGNIGSYYCMDCYLLVHKQTHPALAAPPAQDAARDVELLLSAYKGLLVLHRIMVKSGLHAGEKTTSELADRIVAAHPEFPARAALRAIGGDA